jgi:hypothetical protein
MAEHHAIDTAPSGSTVDVAAAHAPLRAAYRVPTLRVHGDVAALTLRNWWAPGRQDGSNWFRRTG